jgi:hypothetical protein
MRVISAKQKCMQYCCSITANCFFVQTVYLHGNLQETNNNIVYVILVFPPSSLKHVRLFVTYHEISFWRVLTMVWCISKNLALGLYPSTPKSRSHPIPRFLPEDGSRASFRNVFKEKHWTMDKVLKQDSSKHEISVNSWSLWGTTPT